jgi:hypothetical protein
MIPRSCRIGRNVKIAGDLRTSDFSGRVIRSGASVERASSRRRGRAANESGVPVIATAEPTPEAVVAGGGRGGAGGVAKRR